jgi:sensor domain CHASE-containing protein
MSGSLKKPLMGDNGKQTSDDTKIEVSRYAQMKESAKERYGSMKESAKELYGMSTWEYVVRIVLFLAYAVTAIVLLALSVK